VNKGPQDFLRQYSSEVDGKIKVGKEGKPSLKYSMEISWAEAIASKFLRRLSPVSA
jgi:hypothetical protein